MENEVLVCMEYYESGSLLNFIQNNSSCAIPENVKNIQRIRL